MNAEGPESILRELKQKTLSGSLQKCLQVDSSLSLVPVGPWILEENHLPVLKMLVRWRAENAESFFVRVPASVESMSDYLELHSVGEENRLLFLVRSEGEFVGHLGISQLSGGKATLDNVLRGESVRGQVMRRSLFRLMTWASRELGVAEMNLIVRSDNAKARRFYKSVGFRERKPLPLEHLHLKSLGVITGHPGQVSMTTDLPTS